MIYWLTGQPGSGKTTIGEILVEEEFAGYPAIIIDGDDLRDIFDNKDFSETGRRKNIEFAQNMATFLHHIGYIVVVAMVSPYRDQREAFKAKIGDGIKEAYIHTSNIRGRESYFVENYEQPLENYIDIDTTAITPQQAVDLFFNKEI